MTTNINELIYLYHLQDPEALPLLMETYQPLAARFWRQHAAGMEREDFMQFANMVLVRCLNTYRQDLHLTFSTYYRAALLHQISGLHRHRTEPDPGTVFFSLDQMQSDSDHSVHEAIEDPRMNVSRQVHARLLLDEMVRKLTGKKGEEARRILSLRSIEYSMREIAQKTGLSMGQVRYMLDGLTRSHSGLAEI